MESKFDEILFRLGSLPKCNKEDIYLWADYIELKCLISQDHIYSKADLIDDYKQRTRDLGEGDDSLIRTRIDRLTEDRAALDDKDMLFVDDCFRLISLRIKAFKSSYPFVLTDNQRALQVQGKITLRRKAYLFLLFSSNLSFFSPFNSILTGSFELFCVQVFKDYLPSNAMVQVFGSSNSESQDKNKVKLSKFWEKLTWLAEFLEERVLITEHDLSKYDKGDGGLDLVAKVPTGDNLAPMPIYFAQCACSPKEWRKKQNEVKYDRWSNFLTLSTYPIAFVFVPFSYRDSLGRWFRKTRIEKTILVDRQRLLNSYISDVKKLKILDSYKLIDQILKLKDPIV